MGDIPKHIEQLSLTAGQPEKFEIAIENFQMLFGFIDAEFNVKQQSFAVMVHSIGGEEKKDFSLQGLKRTLKDIDDLGLTQGELKKKLMKYRKASENN